MADENNENINIEGISEALNTLGKVLLKLSGGSLISGENDNLSSIEKIKINFRDLINELAKSTKEFDPSYFIEILNKYLTKDKRLLYSEFTLIIIKYNESNSGDQAVGTIITNLENCISFAMDEQNSIDDVVKKTLIKLWDHANLASNQYNYFMTTDDVFSAKLNPLLNPKIDELKEQYSTLENEVSSASTALKDSIKEVQNTKYKIVSDIIGLISIFVAISFVLFGGMTLLNNLFDFSNMRYVPVTEMLCLGSLIGIILIAIIYAFMVFILKLLEKPYKDKPALNWLLGIIISILVIICCLTFFEWKNDTHINTYNVQETVNQNNETKQNTQNDDKNTVIQKSDKILK